MESDRANRFQSFLQERNTDMATQLFSVAKQVTDALLNDPRTKKSVIDVAFNQGSVTLTGTVKSAEIIRAAEQIARAQPGVLMVTNELKVK